MDADDGFEMETEQGASDDGAGEGSGTGGVGEGRGTVRPREEGGADEALPPMRWRRLLGRVGGAVEPAEAATGDGGRHKRRGEPRGDKRGARKAARNSGRRGEWLEQEGGDRE